MNLLGLSPVLAILVGLRLHSPASPGPWRCFAVGFALFWLGDLYTYSYPRLFGADVPFPSIGDGAYVLVYPALMAGLLMLVRRRNPERDRAGLIDSLIMTLGLSLLSWVALIAPYLHDDVDGHDRQARLDRATRSATSCCSPPRSASPSTPAAASPPSTCSRSSIVALLVTDFAYGVVTLQGAYDGQVILDVGWISFYLLWGAAALHPSMRGLERPAADRDPKLTPLRLGLLTVRLADRAGRRARARARPGRHGPRSSSSARRPSSSASSSLRMAGLVRQQERSVVRERALSGAGAALVAATSREEIARAALDAIGSLVGPDAEALLCLVEDDALQVVAARTVAVDGAAWTVAPATAGALLGAAADERRSTLPLTPERRTDLRLGGVDPDAFVLGLSVRSEIRGLLVVCGEHALARTAQSGLRSLATQVSLALESAALTEEVHRHASEARFGSLIRASSDLITVLDSDARVVYQSPSIERVLGYRPEEVVGTSFARLLPTGEQSRLLHLLDGAVEYDGDSATEVLECALRHRDGDALPVRDPAHEPAARRARARHRPQQPRRLRAQGVRGAARPPGLPRPGHRASPTARCSPSASATPSTRARRDHIGLAVIFIDLDDFKTINDSLGHAAGDRVLLEVGKRLATSIRASDTAARFGGDEFAVLLEGVESAQEAADTAERILEALAVPLALEHKELVTRASMGISMVEGEAATDAEEMIRNADAAMYIAKRDGKGGYRLFEPAMHEGVLARLELRADLQRALAADQFELHYQPVVRLHDGRATGVEALVRWRHPERGLVPPDQFIPFAEEIGLIVPIGRWVLREGCRQAVLMQRTLPSDPPMTMAINLSVKQLQHSDIVGDVRDALADSGLDPASLTLEITETVMMTDTELVVQRLKELKDLGVRLAMDDFGTGYSSLSYLSKFPVDILKMDRSFLREDASPETAGLATAVVSLGETLQLEVVAEGIELSEQWTTLRDLGCDKGQGYFFARPMDSDSVLDFLRSSQAAVPAAPDAPSEPPRADAP